MNNLYRPIKLLIMFIVGLIVAKKIKNSKRDKIPIETTYWLVGDIKFKSFYQARAYANYKRHNKSQEIQPIKVKELK